MLRLGVPKYACGLHSASFLASNPAIDEKLHWQKKGCLFGAALVWSRKF